MKIGLLLTFFLWSSGGSRLPPDGRGAPDPTDGLPRGRGSFLLSSPLPESWRPRCPWNLRLLLDMMDLQEITNINYLMNN